MKPKPTMTEAEEAAWQRSIGEAGQTAGHRPILSKLIDKQAAVPVKRRRAYTVEDLWKLWAKWQNIHRRSRDGAEFLLWLEGK